MKIVYCLQTLYGIGGVERTTITKVNWLAAQGYDITIVTTDECTVPEDSPFTHTHTHIRHIDLGINYEEDNTLGRWKRFRSLRIKQRKHRKMMEELLQEIRPDVTVVTFPGLSFFSSLQDGSKKILELHNSKYSVLRKYSPERWLARLYGRFQIWKRDRIARKYDKLVILTEEERKSFKNFSNLEVIPNPLPFTCNKIADYSSKKVVAIGRFEYQKNFPELIDIWAKVSKQYPDWQLEFVGDGYMRWNLEEQIKRLQLEHSITLFGATRNVEERLLSSSVKCLVSHFEGFGMVLIEAQTVGLPIVSYACPSGPRDIVTDGKDGYLVSPYDKEMFAQRLMTLMESEDLRRQMGSAAKQASQRFELDTVMQKWVRLFEKLVV